MSDIHEATGSPLELNAKRQLDDGIWLFTSATIRMRAEGGFVCYWWVKAFVDITSSTYVEARHEDMSFSGSFKDLKVQSEERSSLAANYVVAQVRAAVSIWKDWTSESAGHEGGPSVASDSSVAARCEEPPP